MTKYSTVSLSGCSARHACSWYDDWCGGCSCTSSGCANGCSAGGCANGCGTNGCVNGCGANACVNGCSTGCGTCQGGWDHACCSWDACACLWPDAPALQSGGVLMPRIIGSGRLCQRVRDLTLCVQDIPDAAVAPYALHSVSASGPVDWEFIAVERHRAILRAIIPLTAVIRDCNGCFFTGHSSVTVEVPVHITIPTADLGRAHVALQPGVRMLCAAKCSEDGCFTVSLAVLVDVYVARWEASADGTTIPCRPDLPLTLPPSYHDCCSPCHNPCW